MDCLKCPLYKAFLQKLDRKTKITKELKSLLLQSEFSPETITRVLKLYEKEAEP